MSGKRLGREQVESQLLRKKPSNMIALQAMVNTIAAGLVGLIVALLLLSQVGRHRKPDNRS